MTAELEEDLHCIVECGGSGWYHLMLPRPNFCLNRHRERSSIHLKMNDIELPECATFCLLRLLFTPKLN